MHLDTLQPATHITCIRGAGRQRKETMKRLFYVVPLLPSRKQKGPQTSPHQGQNSMLHAQSSKEAKEEGYIKLPAKPKGMQSRNQNTSLRQNREFPRFNKQVY